MQPDETPTSFDDTNLPRFTYFDTFYLPRQYILIQFYKAKRLSEELSFSEKPFLHIKLCYSALAIAILKSF